MVNKNIQMKKREGGSWDNLFPVTLTENVYDKTGNSVDSEIERLNQKDETLNTIKADKIFVDSEIERLDLKDENIVTQLEQTNQDLIDRGINLRSLGAKLDGVTDDFTTVRNALDTYNHVVIPYGVTLATSETIVIKPNQSLSAGGEISKLPVIKYIGEEKREKTVVQIGLNGVGKEPDERSENITFTNIHVDADYKIGFAVYGMYLTNETIIKNIVAEGSTEYNMYFARGWYAKLQNLTSKNCLNNGIALGMPLVYSDGYEVNFQKNNPIEMNNMKIDDVRSTRSGSHFWEDNPGLFDVKNESHHRRGWGLGFGIGNGFRVENFLSERSGGVNLYVYNGSQPSKTIRNGYLEQSQENSNTDAPNEKASMIIHNTHTAGGVINIEDIYIHPNSGGIYHKGAIRIVKLKKIYDPSFLRSLNEPEDLPDEGVMYFILKEEVSWRAGTSDRRPGKALSVLTETVNTRYNWSVDIDKPEDSNVLLYIRKISETDLIGGYRLRLENGTSNTYSYPNDLTTSFKYIQSLSSSGIRLEKTGGTQEYTSEIEIKLVVMPPTSY